MDPQVVNAAVAIALIAGGGFFFLRDSLRFQRGVSGLRRLSGRLDDMAETMDNPPGGVEVTASGLIRSSPREYYYEPPRQAGSQERFAEASRYRVEAFVRMLEEQHVHDLSDDRAREILDKVNIILKEREGARAGRES